MVGHYIIVFASRSGEGALEATQFDFLNIGKHKKPTHQNRNAGCLVVQYQVKKSSDPLCGLYLMLLESVWQ